jgi:hypothetical protein
MAETEAEIAATQKVIDEFDDWGCETSWLDGPSGLKIKFIV